MTIKRDLFSVYKLLILLMKKIEFIEVVGTGLALYTERPVMVPVIKQNRRIK